MNAFGRVVRRSREGITPRTEYGLPFYVRSNSTVILLLGR